ncbi:hypothetical protein A6B43_04620 [Vespertiliibacter pulmonis]|uniref:FkbM family methyltransferase n=1 Tax=Vespertiliibacter pulmonis TaxID=1443036 RepID=A0A3N4WBV0_9PAST|nr:FkbM family methyltransferase [Vespertiliibacter pulmonis]QLB20859.1 hypothetical protein A6B43_04620 [Vespertiliibacter pulmonis]RPE83510.1 FkbM family methyltransferase [Vespertiliibacter pulmonis]
MKTYLQDLRWGKFNLIKGDMISDIASQYGEWSDVEVCIFQQLLNTQSNVIEVGSNIGMHSVPLAKMIPNGKLICFEPQRIIFQQLCCNLALNNLTNVETFRIGVSNQMTTQWIETSDYNQRWNYGSFSLNHGFNTEGRFLGNISHEEIDIIALDNFPPIQYLPSLTLLKIDAEGLDISVLQGAQNIIQLHHPFIFIEVHNSTVEDTLKELNRQEYQAYWIISERYQSDNFNQSAPIESGIDINFLCVPNHLDENISETYPIFNKLVKVKSIEQLFNRSIPLLRK